MKYQLRGTKTLKNPRVIRWCAYCFLVWFWFIVPPSGIAYPTLGRAKQQKEPDLKHTTTEPAGRSTDMDSQPIGPTYPIIEDDFISVLQARFKQYRDQHPQGLKATGLSRLKQHLQTIEPTTRLPRAQQYRFWYENPTIVLARDITDDQNNVIAARGTAVNPLIATPLNETLVFFDANDPQQIDFVKRTLKRAQQDKRDKPEQNKTHYKLIVVQGNILAAQTQLKERLYADQHGELTNHFHLQRLPTLVKQVSLRLKLEEFPMRATNQA